MAHGIHGRYGSRSEGKEPDGGWGEALAFRGCVGRGDYELLVPGRAWGDNPTAQCINAIQWQRPGREDGFELVVVNLAPHRAQCRVRISARGLSGHQWVLSDRLGEERWERDGAEIAATGLYLDLEGRGARLFSVRRAVA